VILSPYKHPTTQQRASEAWPRFEYVVARHFISAVDTENRNVDPRLWLKPNVFAVVSHWCASYMECMKKSSRLRRFAAK
jgi:hypothetical protein